jgi:geranylgeranyl pyrophosphate synthase
LVERSVWDREVASSNPAVPTYCMPKKFTDYKKTIDLFLRQYLQEKHDSFTAINSWGPDVINRLKDFVASGKTIRGCLVLFSCDMFEGKHKDDAIKAACALELIHSGLLIHDDIMDQDRLRRGNDAMYVQYERLGDQRFGESMAICVGDLTFFLGLELVSQHKDVHELITRELSSVCFAQMQDVSFAHSKITPKKEDVLAMYRYKTARYTFSLPMMIGAMFADADKKSIQQLSVLGEHMGLLFQIQDDVLNVSGTTSQTGKPVGSDLREDKKTYASINTDVQSEVNNLYKKNETLIHSLPINETYKAELLHLLNFIRTRKS